MKLILLFLCVCVCALSNGQFVEPKFGKIELQDMTMTKYDKDITAGALILFDNGTSDFILNNEMSFQFVYQRHCLIKIFKKSAFNVADISIRLYNANANKENLDNLKAITYNLIDGKIIKTKLDNDNIYRAEGKNYTDVKFAFPEIKEGSIIELSYKISSDFLYNFRGWSFQYSYPARWSQYYYSIPEYFRYRESSKGYLKFDVMKKTQGTVTFSIPSINIVGSGISERHKAGASDVLTAVATKTILGVSNVPAFVSEPNIDCEDNYIQSIEFELSSIQLPEQDLKDYTESWESVNTRMKKDEDFGALLKMSFFLKDTVNAVCKNKTTDIDKAVAIYNYIQNRMKWNGNYQIWAAKGLKKPFADGTGSSSEINLLLTLMLQTAGLKANPVMFSTRDNGIANAFFPTITKFNSVLSSVEIEGKPVLLDAVSKYCQFGVLPANDINGKGRVVNDLSGDWVNLISIKKYEENKHYTLEIGSDGKLSGSIISNYDGYAGIYFRNELNSEKNSDEYFRKLQESLKGLTINKYSIADRFNNYKPLSDTLYVELTDHAELIGDKILFNPLLFEKIEKNKYTLEERKYPVDYNYPFSEVYRFNYTLPPGFKVESLPQSFSLNLPDNSISITYTAQSIDNKITIVYNREIKKILFLPSEYNELKNLYDQLVKKHAEQIILKKSI